MKGTLLSPTSGSFKWDPIERGSVSPRVPLILTPSHAQVRSEEARGGRAGDLLRNCPTLLQLGMRPEIGLDLN